MTLGTFVKNLLSKATDERNIVDIYSVVTQMGFKVETGTLKVADKGQLFPQGCILPDVKTDVPTIVLNRLNREEESRTAIALLVADYLLTCKQNKNKVLTCDTFFLGHIREYKVTRQLFLATRLALPEDVIEKISDIRFSTPAYALEAKLLLSFVNCAYTKKDVDGLLGIIDTLDFSFSIGRKIGSSHAPLEQYLPHVEVEAANNPKYSGVDNKASTHD